MSSTNNSNDNNSRPPSNLNGSGLQTRIEEPRAFILFCRIKASVYTVIAIESVLLAFGAAALVSAVAMGFTPYSLLYLLVMLAMIGPLYAMYKGVQSEKCSYLAPYLISKVLETVLCVAGLVCLFVGLGPDRHVYPDIFGGFVALLVLRVVFNVGFTVMVLQCRRFFAQKDRFNYWNQPSFPYVVPIASITSLSIATPYDTELF